MATDTVADLANKAIYQMYQAGQHPLELSAEARAANDSGAPEDQADASWEHLSAEQRSFAKSNVDVYLDDSISIV